MANLQGTTVTGNLAVTGTIGGQGAVPVGGIVAVASGLTGAYTMPGSGAVNADGWMLCDGESIPGSQTLSGTAPDLTDGRFLRGFTSSGGTGGSANFTLAEANLAAHTHGGATGACSATTGDNSADHTHTLTTGGQDTNHCHCINNTGTHTHSYTRTLGGAFGYTASGPCVYSYTSVTCTSGATEHGAEYTCQYSADHCHTATTGNVSANHTHSVASHTHTVSSAGSGTAKEHLPIYYNVQYLLRVI